MIGKKDKLKNEDNEEEKKLTRKEKRAAKKAQKNHKTERQKVEERREEVLANGRKYKYPMQYAKHRVVWLTTIIAVFAIMAVATLGYVLLYKMQNTSDILYRITQVLPVSVAEIDGEKVRYSDYLMIYRSTITPIEKQQGQLGSGDDADSMRDYYKRHALIEAENYTYALKIARENNITVSDDEVSAAIDEHRKAGNVDRSEETFKRILSDNFGLTMGEYRRMVYLSLVELKVSQEIDTTANLLAKDVETAIKKGTALKEIADNLGERVIYEATNSPVDTMNVDGGRAIKALSMEVNQVSERFLSTAGDGYYYVKTVEKGDNSVKYESVQIPFTEFDTMLEKVRAENKIVERIELKNDEENGTNEEFTPEE